eukprot:jgi/Mesvir1/20291/Mv19897-RA.4
MQAIGRRPESTRPRRVLVPLDDPRLANGGASSGVDPEAARARQLALDQAEAKRMEAERKERRRQQEIQHQLALKAKAEAEAAAKRAAEEAEAARKRKEEEEAAEARERRRRAELLSGLSSEEEDDEDAQLSEDEVDDDEVAADGLESLLADAMMEPLKAGQVRGFSKSTFSSRNLPVFQTLPGGHYADYEPPGYTPPICADGQQNLDVFKRLGFFRKSWDRADWLRLLHEAKSVDALVSVPGVASGELKPQLGKAVDVHFERVAAPKPSGHVDPAMRLGMAGFGPGVAAGSVTPAGGGAATGGDLVPGGGLALPGGGNAVPGASLSGLSGAGVLGASGTGRASVVVTTPLKDEDGWTRVGPGTGYEGKSAGLDTSGKDLNVEDASSSVRAASGSSGGGVGEAGGDLGGGGGGGGSSIAGTAGGLSQAGPQSQGKGGGGGSRGEGDVGVIGHARSSIVAAFQDLSSGFDVLPRVSSGGGAARAAPGEVLIGPDDGDGGMGTGGDDASLVMYTGGAAGGMVGGGGASMQASMGAGGGGIMSSASQGQRSLVGATDAGDGFFHDNGSGMRSNSGAGSSRGGEEDDMPMGMGGGGAVGVADSSDVRRHRMLLSSSHGHGGHGKGNGDAAASQSKGKGGGKAGAGHAGGGPSGAAHKGTGGKGTENKPGTGHAGLEHKGTGSKGPAAHLKSTVHGKATTLAAAAPVPPVVVDKKAGKLPRLGPWSGNVGAPAKPLGKPPGKTGGKPGLKSAGVAGKPGVTPPANPAADTGGSGLFNFFRGLTGRSGRPAEGPLLPDYVGTALGSLLEHGSQWRNPAGAALLKAVSHVLESLRDGEESSCEASGIACSDYAREAGIHLHRHMLGRCAIVGLGPNLLDRKYGPAIDAHDSVIRFGGAPIKGKEAHVGSKTSVSILREVPMPAWDAPEGANEIAALAGQAEGSLSRPGASVRVVGGSVMGSDTWGASSIVPERFYLSHGLMGIPVPKGHATSRIISQSITVHNNRPYLKYFAISRDARGKAERLYHSLREHAIVKGALGITKRDLRPSIGFVMVYAIIHSGLCSHVDLYGFTPDGAAHYFEGVSAAKRDAAGDMNPKHVAGLEWFAYKVAMANGKLCLYV